MGFDIKKTIMIFTEDDAQDMAHCVAEQNGSEDDVTLTDEDMDVIKHELNKHISYINDRLYGIVEDLLEERNNG